MATKFETSAKLESVNQAVLPVSVDNFKRAESDMYFSAAVSEGGFGKLYHRRELFSVDAQSVVRGNRDTIYSSGVFDLDAAPVTITIPDAGNRFMSMMVVNEDHFVFTVEYKPGKYTFSRETIGTRYVLIALRTLVDPSDPADLKTAHSLQDAVKVEQQKTGTFEVPAWDKASQKKVRDALIILNETSPDFKHSFGSKGEVDPVRHLIATAAAWGGNPDKDAIYLNVVPPQNDAKTIYQLTVKDVPVDAFWSVTVYNASGYFEKNNLNAYSINNITAKKNEDGSITIQFGGCDGKVPNCLPIVPGWNYTVRLYRPRPEILEGKWRFPEPVPIK